ncbi:hypothetical protein Pla100_08660 [Neorhodopirellula pilleata]|uniref:Uncharacterized protein n=1 Tax=Neorhodopirellula pilleata TaxID=2714738 RepID=A0A5C6AVZ0_9BACT|nr:hypothetical protein Pla100_08660 [Neorhodopirellula pilleata]
MIRGKKPSPVCRFDCPPGFKTKNLSENLFALAMIKNFDFVSRHDDEAMNIYCREGVTKREVKSLIIPLGYVDCQFFSSSFLIDDEWSSPLRKVPRAKLTVLT